MNRMTYRMWRCSVDRRLRAATGCGTAIVDWWDWMRSYNEGLTPAQTVEYVTEGLRAVDAVRV